jgi:hypothetical protein
MAAAMRTAIGRLGFSVTAATAIVDEQDINSVDELRLLSDDECTNLCKVVRRPGGTVANPQAGVAGQPALIPNPGITVSLRAENNLKLCCYWLRYKEKVSRAITPADILLDPIRAIRGLKEWEA